MSNVIVSREIECQRATLALPWLLNGTLSTEERREVRGHLVRCAECRRQLALTRATYSLFNDERAGTGFRARTTVSARRRFVHRYSRVAAGIIITVAVSAALWSGWRFAADAGPEVTTVAATEGMHGRTADGPLFREDFESGQVGAGFQGQSITRLDFEGREQPDGWEFQSSIRTTF